MIRDISPFLIGPSVTGIIYWLRASWLIMHAMRHFSLQERYKRGSNRASPTLTLGLSYLFENIQYGGLGHVFGNY